MIIVDVECSGVDPYKDSLVSVGALEFENPANQFYAECRIWNGAHVEDQALAVNGFTLTEITDPKKPSDGEVASSFIKWAMKCKDHTIAGHNVSFDRDFLMVAAMRAHHVDWPLSRRLVDLHSIVYFHMIKRGMKPPTVNGHSDLNSDKILLYVGMPEEPKPHNALMGAKVEAEALSRLFYGRPLLDEFAIFDLPDLQTPRAS